MALYKYYYYYYIHGRPLTSPSNRKPTDHVASPPHVTSAGAHSHLPFAGVHTARTKLEASVTENLCVNHSAM